MMTTKQNSQYAAGLLSAVHEAAAQRSLLIPTIPERTPEYRRKKLQAQRQKKRDEEIAYVRRKYAGCRLFIRIPAACFTVGAFERWIERRNSYFPGASKSPFYTGVQRIDEYYYFTINEGYGIDPMLYAVNFVHLMEKYTTSAEDAAMSGELEDFPMVSACLVRVPE